MTEKRWSEKTPEEIERDVKTLIEHHVKTNGENFFFLIQSNIVMEKQLQDAEKKIEASRSLFEVVSLELRKAQKKIESITPAAMAGYKLLRKLRIATDALSVIREKDKIEVSCLIVHETPCGMGYHNTYGRFSRVANSALEEIKKLDEPPAPPVKTDL